MSNLQASERGATMLEYVLTAALIAIVCISSIGLVGASSSNAFANAANGISGNEVFPMGIGGPPPE